MNLLLSIIIPTYGRDLTLKRCLDSIFIDSANINTLFEVIVIDDAKSQSTKEIVESFSNTNFLYFTKNHNKFFNDKGAASSRNLGIKKAKGKYILFLDDDDYLGNGSLEKIFNIISKNNSKSFIWFNNLVRQLYSDKIRDNNCNLSDMMIKNLIPMGAFLIERKKIKHFFDTSIKSHEDWLFLLENIFNLDCSYVPEIISVIDKTSKNSVSKNNQVHFYNDFKYIYEKVPTDNKVVFEERLKILTFLKNL